MSGTPAEKPLRVLMLSNMYPSAEEPGYGSFIQRQERELTDRFGVEIKLIATPRRGEGMANFTKYASLLWQTVSATVLGGYDIVHAHYLLPVAAFALIPAGLRRKPLVITAHGTDIFSGTVWPWRPLIIACASFARAASSWSRSSSPSASPRTSASPNVPGREFVIANMGVNTERFTPGDAAALKAAAGIPADVAHLLFVGNFVEQKGVVDLARALVMLARAGSGVPGDDAGARPGDARGPADRGATRRDRAVPHGHLARDARRRVSLGRPVRAAVTPRRCRSAGLPRGACPAACPWSRDGPVVCPRSSTTARTACSSNRPTPMRSPIRSRA